MKKSLYIFLILIAGAFLASVKVMDLQVHQELICGGWVAIAVFTLILVVDFRARKMLDLIHLYLFGAILRVGIGGVFAGVVLNSEHSDALSTMGYLPVENMYKGFLIMQWGTLMALLGIVVFENKQAQKTVSLSKPAMYPPTYKIFAAVLFAWGFRFMSMRGFPGFGVLGYAVTVIPDAALFIFTYLAVCSRRGRAMHWWLVCAIIMVQYYFARFSFMREAYAFVVLPLILAFAFSLTQQKNADQPVISQKRIRFKASRFIPLGFVSALIIYFFLTVILPAATLVKNQQAASMKAAINEVLTTKKERVLREDFPDKGIYALPVRMAVLVTAPAIIVEQRADGYRMESGPLENFAAAMIPRAIWKNKPNISKGRWFAQFLNPAAWNTQTSVAMTAPGEFYWGYGWTGMIIAMFLFGGVLRIFWNYLFLRIKSQPAAVLTFIILCQECFRWFESEFSRPMSLLTLLFILTYILITFVFKERKHPDAPGVAR